MSKPTVALVTGAARGLGLEVARQLAVEGVRCVITARDPSSAAAAAATANVEALPVPLDVTDPLSVGSAAEAMRSEYGRLDILINNAAAYVDWSEAATNADLLASYEVLDVNLFGAWRMVQAMLPLLEVSPRPRIVNVSSGAGSHSDPAFGLTARNGRAASYGISKAALNALTSTLAAELSGMGIIVTAVCPGLTATWPGAEQMGARPVTESAQGVVWAAMLPDGSPSGGLYRDGEPLGW